MNSYQDEEQQEKQSVLAPSSHVLATAQSKQKQQQTLTFSYHPNEAQKSGRPNTLTKQEKKDFNQFKEMLDPTDIVQSTMPHEKEKNIDLLPEKVRYEIEILRPPLVFEETANVNLHPPPYQEKKKLENLSDLKKGQFF